MDEKQETFAPPHGLNTMLPFIFSTNGLKNTKFNNKNNYDLLSILPEADSSPTKSLVILKLERLKRQKDELNSFLEDISFRLDKSLILFDIPDIILEDIEAEIHCLLSLNDKIIEDDEQIEIVEDILVALELLTNYCPHTIDLIEFIYKNYMLEYLEKQKYYKNNNIDYLDHVNKVHHEAISDKNKNELHIEHVCRNTEKIENIQNVEEIHENSVFMPNIYRILPEKDNKYRNVRQNKKIPPTRVNKNDYIIRKTEVTPVSIKEQRNIQNKTSNRLKNDTSDNIISLIKSETRNWQIIEFPKLIPSLNKKQLELFLTWKTNIDSQLEFKFKDPTSDHKDLTSFLTQSAHMELIVYELSRLIFSKCPSTARFFHGIWISISELYKITSNQLREEIGILEQVATFLQTEVDLHQDKVTKETIRHEKSREKIKIRNREIIAEKEKKIMLVTRLNEFLGLDQSLLKAIIDLCHSILDTLTGSMNNMILSTSDNINEGAKINGTIITRQYISSEVLDRLKIILIGKKNRDQMQTELQIATIQWSQRKKKQYNNQMDVSPTINNDLNIISDENIKILKIGKVSSDDIILTKNEENESLEEIDNIINRINKLMTVNTPDCEIGWNPQDVSFQAVFLPQLNEILILEKKITDITKKIEHIIISNFRLRNINNFHSIKSQTTNSYCRTRYHLINTVNIVKENDKINKIDDIKVNNNDTISTIKKKVLSTEESTKLSFFDTLTLVKQSKKFKNLVPELFKNQITCLPIHYEPHCMTPKLVHIIISFILNETFIFHGKKNDNNINEDYLGIEEISTSTIAQCIYNIFLSKYIVAVYANSRLLDFLISLQHFDTQSDKIHLFSRFLNLPGVNPLPARSFWFIVDALYILQKKAPRGYFHLDNEGNEFVPQMNAWQGLSIMFNYFTIDVQERIKTKLTSFANALGAVWLPVYGILRMALDEWLYHYNTTITLIENQFNIKIEHKSKNEMTTCDNQIINKKDTILTVDKNDYIFHFNDFKDLVLEINKTVHDPLIARLFRVSLHRCNSFSLDPKICSQIFMELGVVHESSVKLFQRLKIRSTSEISELMVEEKTHILNQILISSWNQSKEDISRILDRINIYNDNNKNNARSSLHIIQEIDNIIQDSAGISINQRWQTFEKIIQIAYHDENMYNIDTNFSHKSINMNKKLSYMVPIISF